MMYPPEFPPNKGNAAEEQVFRLLKALLDPARYDVFYGRQFVREYGYRNDVEQVRQPQWR